MPKYVAFLRAINVGKRIVKMDELRRLFEALKFQNVETFIASGNVIFDAKSTDTAALERKIEAHLKAGLGYEVVTFLRTIPEIAAVAAYAPFPKAKTATAHAVHVGFVAEPLGADAKKELAALASAFDTFHVNGREVYWMIDGLSSTADSKFTNTLFEKKCKASVTFRNTSTVRKLAAKYCDGGS